MAAPADTHSDLPPGARLRPTRANPSQPPDVRPDPAIPLAAPDEGVPIYQAFLDLARRAGAGPAVSDGRQALTYAELETRSATLSATIRAAAGPRSRVVAIHGQRNTGLVVAMLAVARAGLTFAVLDAAYPPARLRQMAVRLEPALYLGDEETDPDWRAAFDDSGASFLALDAGGCPRAAAAARPDPAPHADIAYLLFTSGTTGVPRCIAVGHAPLRHFVAWYTDTFRPGPGDRFSLLSGLAHDPMLRDIFVPLSVGAEIRIPPRAVITQPRPLFDWIHDRGITFLHGTPQLFTLMDAGAQEADRQAAALRAVFSGGDRLPRTVADAVHRFAPAAQFANFYGTTETPQAVACYLVRRDESGPIPIGRGIRDVQVLVLTPSRTLAAVGEPGEIGIRTRFLSAGYYGDPAATMQRYISSPFSDDPADRLYLTGDTGCYRSDGEVVIRGRADDQVKIRGFRVELGEINQVLESQPAVRGAITLAHTAPGGDKLLVAYVASPPELRETIHAALERLLRDRLPAYMVPARIVGLDRLPLLPNGKVDRSALATLWQSQQEAAAAPGTPDEHPAAAIARAWCRILGVPRVDPGQSFAEMGGDSMSFIQASLAVRRTLGWLPEDWSRVPLAALAERRVRERQAWYLLDASIVLRAVSIFLIVLGHITPYEVNGSVAALFMLAGWSFAGFLCRAVLRADSPRPILGFMLRLAVPTVLAVAWQNWGHATERWWAFVMLSNYFPVYAWRVAGFWFMDVLLQIFALLVVLFAFRPVRRAAAADPFRFGLAATGVALAAGAAVHTAWDTAHLYNYVPHMYLWIVFFGMAAWHADTWRRRVVLATLLVAVAASHRFLHVFHVAPFSLAAALGLLAVRRIPVPALAAPVLAAVASASLYIYITHDRLGALIYGHLLGAPVAYEPLGAIQFHSVAGLRGILLTGVLVAGGVAIGAAYNRLAATLRRALSRRAPEAAAAPDAL